MTVKKKCVIIITLWVTSLIIFYFVIHTAAFKIYEANSIDELLDTTKSITDVVESYSKNDDFTRKEIDLNHEARINGLVLALEDTENIQDVNEFLKEYKEAGGIEAIAVYDEYNNLVYNDGFKDDDETDTTDVYYLESGNRWLVKIKYGYTDKENGLEYLNDWTRRLANVIISKNGFIMAVDKKNDRVLSCSFGTDDSVENLNMEYEGKALDYEAFKELFSETDKVHKIKIDDVSIYGTRIKYDKMYLLALIPETDILYDVRNMDMNLMIVFALLTGLAMLFLIFTLTDALKEGDSAKYRKPSSKLLMSLILSLVLIFCSSLWIELLEISVDKYIDSKSMVSYITSKLEAEDAFETMRDNYLDKEYLDKCLMVKSIIKAAGHPLQMSDLDRIAKKMGIDYISVYDEKGKNVLTNSPFSEDQISKGGYFYPLLMGRDSMIKDPDNDNVQGRIIQYIGASIQNDQGTSDGLVLIGMDLTALKDIRDSLGFENIIRQGNLLEGTFLALIDKSTSMFKNAALVENKEAYEEQNKYNYFSVAGEDKDSKYNRYAYYLLGEEDINLGEDYTNMSLEDLGLTPEVLNTNYSGRQTIKNIDYYACSSKFGDDICLVMRQENRIEFDNLVPVLLSTLVAFFFMLFMMIVFMQPGNALEEEKYASMQENQDETANKESATENDYLSIFDEVFDARKPLFTRRWPEDSKLWKDKDSSEKRRTILHVITLIFVVLIIGQQLFFNSINDDSIWYYVLSPEWNGGVNVITITKSGIAVIFLLAISFIIHKILYFIARASGPHIETICHLLNSFIKYATFIAGVFICISIFNVNMSLEFSVSAGVVSVIVSIACQSIFADIFAGIFMVFEGVVTAGEYVYFNNRYGSIINIGIRTTQIRWFSEVMVVRNSEFKNYVNIPSLENDRLDVTVCIDFNESLARVESIFLEEFEDMHQRFVDLTGDTGLAGPEYMGVQKFTDNGVGLRFAIYTKGCNMGILNREFHRELKMMFERNNIRFALPQIVVNEPAKYAQPPENNYPEPLSRLYGSKKTKV